MGLKAIDTELSRHTVFPKIKHATPNILQIGANKEILINFIK